MTSNADPWRTLGLTPGATPDEIRRAYRRLAKINHPDAGGDAALPRFLAIQAAYDQLTGVGRSRRVGARPAGRTPSPGAAASDGAAPREPWRADPNRARASGRADGRRTPGARPAGPGSGAAGPGAGAGPKPGSRGGTGAKPPGAAGGPTDDGRTGGPSTGRARRSSSSRGGRNTATPGSTSYEGADKEPFEPGWTGAGWYGASSGTYWTINPKEYADPRKHGPEYQARARRSRGEQTLDDPAADRGAGAAPDLAGESSADGPASRDAGPDSRPSQQPTDAPIPDPIVAGQTRRRPVGRRPSTDGAPATSPPGAAATATSATNATFAPAMGRGPGDGAPPTGGLRAWIEQPPEDAGFRAPLLRRATTPTGRVAMALLGWPPLGLFAATAIDRSTGCGTYAASCSELSSPGTWIVQAAILLFLLALPAVAAWSAHGAIAALIVGVPSAIVLSAAGGTNVREASAPILLTVLALAYLGGVIYAVIARRRSPMV